MPPIGNFRLYEEKAISSNIYITTSFFVNFLFPNILTQTAKYIEDASYSYVRKSCTLNVGETDIRGNFMNLIGNGKTFYLLFGLN